MWDSCRQRLLLETRTSWPSFAHLCVCVCVGILVLEINKRLWIDISLC